MKIQPQIDALENLAALDAELLELDEELSQQSDALDKKKEQLLALDEAIGKDQAAIDEMERTRGELVQEARQMTVQLERSREKLSRCRTEREVNAAQREIEEVRKLYRDRELEIEKIQGFADQARTAMNEKTQQREVLASELGSSAGDVESRLGQLKGQADEKRKARKALVDKVPHALYRRYELIRKRRGSALAHTEDGTCSACHMRIVPMMYQQLLRGDEFQQCPSCNRILYYRAEAASPAEAESQSGA